MWSAVLPDSDVRPEAVRHWSATVADGPSSARGRTTTDVLRPRGADHAAVQTGTQLVDQQVHLHAGQPRLQPSHLQVGGTAAPLSAFLK